MIISFGEVKIGQKFHYGHNTFIKIIPFKASNLEWNCLVIKDIEHPLRECINRFGNLSTLVELI